MLKRVFFLILCIIISLAKECYTSSKTSLTKELNKETFKVKRCIDGDTIVLDNDVKVRILGIDTFDKSKKQMDRQMKITSFSRKEILELQKEGTEFCKLHLENKEVTLIKDRKDKDVYKRLLRYVEINGEDYGEMILKSKKAMIYCGDKYIERYKTYNKISNWKCNY